MFSTANLQFLQKYFTIIHGKNATISDFADLPRREQFDIESLRKNGSM